MLKVFWKRLKGKIFGYDADFQIKIIGEELRLVDKNTGIYFKVVGEEKLMESLKNIYKEE